MRYLVLIIACSFGAVASAAAQTPLARPGQPGWSRTAEGCFVWNPKPSEGETVSWSGPCKNGLASGTGTKAWQSGGTPGSSYIGEMVDGREEGHGTLTYRNGNRFEGEWHDGKPNGPGVYVTSKVILRGTWKDGCFNNGMERAWVNTDGDACP